MYSHPLEELALYVFSSYTGNFPELYLEKRQQLDFKAHPCKSYGFSIISGFLFCFCFLKDKNNRSDISGNILLGKKKQTPHNNNKNPFALWSQWEICYNAWTLLYHVAKQCLSNDVQTLQQT